MPTHLSEIFAGSDRAFGQYTISEEQGDGNKVEGKAKTVLGQITLEHWQNHWEGKIGLGVVPIRTDNTCLWGAIDIDEYDLDLIQLEKECTKLKLPLTLCRTKSGGAHLYMFFKEPVPANLVQDKLIKCKESLGFPDAEVFPKQTELGADDNGNWLNMPFFGGERTTRYSIVHGKAVVGGFVKVAERRKLSTDELHTLDPPPPPPEEEPEPDRKKKPKKKEPELKRSAITSTISSGGRNTILFKEACSLLAKGYTHDNVLMALETLNNTQTEQPLPYSELKTLFKSAIKTHSRAGEDVQKHVSFTDKANGERLADMYHDEARFHVKAKQWMLYEETRWILSDAPDGGMTLVSRMLEGFKSQAKQMKSEDGVNMLKQLHKLESLSRMKAMITVATNHLVVTPNQLDSDLNLLNVNNGTIDLRTGALRPHSPQDLITKQALVTYDPMAKCELWLQFLNQIMGGDQEVIDFLQRAVGYSLTGDTGEQCFFFLYGDGANGKSTFQNVINNLLNDYAKSADATELFMAKDNQGIPDALAGLAGIRFVSTSEIQAGKRLDEAAMKQLTGQDELSARFLYSSTFQFTPQFKIWMAANHKPTIRGTDYAIWRRIHLIPFNVTIPKEKQDRNLEKKLMNNLSGILNWALEGCLKWREHGLMPPDTVKAATNEYRKEEDHMEQFVDEMCVITPKAETYSTDLYQEYVGWCKHQNSRPISHNKFSRDIAKKLREKNIAKEHDAVGNYWIGIGLRANRENVVEVPF